MRTQIRLPMLAVVLIGLVAGCTPAAPRAASTTDGQPVKSVAPKRIVAAMGSEPSSVDLNVAAYAGFSNYTGIGVMVNSGLSIVNPQGNAVPQMADSVPSIENGLWKLLPNGQMETSWRIRPGAQWHDSAPFTSSDIAFTYQVEEDPEVKIFQQAAYSGIERVETPDASTVRVVWRRPYIYADLSFG